MVGTYLDIKGTHLYIYNGKDGTIKINDTPNVSSVSDINDKGVVVGDYNGWDGFVFSNGKFKTVVFPGLVGRTSIRAINNSGQFVGVYMGYYGDIPSPAFAYYPFIYSGGKFTKITVDPSFQDIGYGYAAFDINNKGQVPMGMYGIRYTQPKLYLYSDMDNRLTTIVISSSDISGAGGPFYGEGYPTGINDYGQVVGNIPTFSDSNISGSFGLLYRGGTFSKIEFPGALGGTWISKINNSGQIAGTYSTGDLFHDPAVEVSPTNSSYETVTHGFVYKNGVYKSFDVPGATGTTISSVNDKGTVIGTYTTGYPSVQAVDGHYTEYTLVTHGFIATLETVPQNEKDCKKGGWKKFGFKRKDQCEKYVDNLEKHKENDEYHQRPSR